MKERWEGRKGKKEGREGRRKENKICLCP